MEFVSQTENLLMVTIFQRANQYLLFAILLVLILYFGKPLLIPLIFGALLAMLMAPMCRRFERWKFPRPLATLTCVLMIVAALATIVLIITVQIAAFSKDVPKIKEKAKTFITDSQKVIEQKLGLPPEKQKEIAKEQTKSTPGKGMSVVKKLISGLASVIGTIALTMVFTFLMIFNKEHFENFFVTLYKDEDESKVRKLVSKIATVSQKYLTGRVMSILINASMYAIGLSIVGIKNAILLACVAAVMTLIPYVGTVLGGLFPVMMALATEDSIQPAIWAAAVLFFIQTVDNYFIEPNIVGGEVDLSALTTIAVLIAGGLLWGPAGMILFLPLTGIAKIVCDNVEPLKPFGLLLGEPGPKRPSKIKLWLKEKFSRK
jgi:predicted PurR-regulated permease PerM